MVKSDGSKCRCPYVEHAPETIEGIAAWELVISAPGQVRVTGMGAVVGLEMSALLEMAGHQGCDPAIMSRLLPSIERGILTGLSDRDKDDDG